MKIDPSTAPEKPTRKRMILGTAVLLTGQLMMAGYPLITALELGDPWDGILKVALLFVLPDLALIAAIAIWGKPGYLYIKSKVFGVLKRGLPADRVGVVRYRIGLLMFTLPIVFAFVEPYLTTVTGTALAKTPYAIAGDVMFVASFFVLGCDFWDKIRSLFVRDAVAQFPVASGV